MSEPIVYRQPTMARGWMKSGRFHFVGALVCIAFFFVMRGQAQMHQALDQRGVDTTGTIVDLRVDVSYGPKSSSGSRSKSYKYIGTFEFLDGSKITRRGETYYSEQGYQNAHKGDTVPVRYLPDDPATYRTYESLAEGTAMAADVFAVLILVSLSVGLVCFVKGYFVQLSQVGAPVEADDTWKRATARVLKKKSSGFLVDRLKLKRKQLLLETVGLDHFGGELEIARIIPAELAKTIEVGDEVEIVYPDFGPHAACLADEFEPETLEQIPDQKSESR